MKTKHTPATPLPYMAEGAIVKAGEHWVASLPWDQPEWGDKREPDAHKDAAYLAHAANAYPKLVEALRDYVFNPDMSSDDCEGNARALLRELGEDA